jgi:iron complex outermembrane receptor protein
MWKTALNWKPTEDLLAYGDISQGVKSGGFNGANANTHSQIVPYRPESLRAYELGLKAAWLNRRVQLNSSAFYYDYKNKQERDYYLTFVGAIGGIANVPKSDIKGLDVDLTWAPLLGLTVNLGGEYLDAKIKEWLSLDPSSQYGQPVMYDNQAGRALSNAPKWQYNASLIYGWDLPGNLRMDLGTDYAYKGATGGAQPYNATASYGIANARLGIGSRNSQWHVMLWGKNLADKYYYPSAFIGGNGPYVRLLGMPRTYGVSFDYRL